LSVIVNTAVGHAALDFTALTGCPTN